MPVSILEQVKIQAQVLVPLLKTLRAELGEAKADALVRQALGQHYRRLGQRWWQAQQGEHLGDNVAAAFRMYAADGALEYQLIAPGADAVGLDVTACRYAQFFQALGLPELGSLLVCEADFPMAEGFGPDIELQRTQTLMQGASHCDFRYRRRDGEREGET